MDFSYKRPTHLLSAFLLTISIFIFLIFPVLTAFSSFSDVDAVNQINDLRTDNELFSIIFEILLILIQITMVLILFILVPFIWYRLVNNLNIRQMCKRIRFTKKHLETATVWGLITAIVALALTIVLSLALNLTGVAPDDASNIEDLELFFSIPSILLLIICQPIAEEIFFRGFLLDKISGFTGINPAIILTSVIFGIAHISMGNIIPALMISIIAIVFGYAIVKTNNLMTGIIGHTVFNLMSFLLYLVGKAFLSEALIL